MAIVNFAAEKKAYKKCRQAGMTVEGACGLVGNLEAESDGFYAKRVEYLCLKRLRENGRIYTDDTYTAAIDHGEISREDFLHPLAGRQYGYGLAQWTSPKRKGSLWDFAKKKGLSIADEDMQIEYLLKELQENYTSVLQVLKTTTSIREASDTVLKKFEIPADTGEDICAARAARGQRFYEAYMKEKNNMEAQQKIEKAIAWMEATANDAAHGYCQDHRWGTDGDYDCSSAVITAWETAGVPVKTKGATYTGNMLGVFMANGFEVITHEINLKTGAGLKRGDVLLNTTHHTAMYCGNGKEVEASINEKGTAHGGKPGDQTGKEFLIRNYRNYPWTHILRYVGNTAMENMPVGGNKYMFSVGNVKNGSKGNDVKLLQRLLKSNACKGSDGKVLVIDGDCGANTVYAIKTYQAKNRLAVDGIAGPATWKSILLR